MKKIIGIDIGTNSVGWAVITLDEEIWNAILGAGSRIIPMSQDVLGKFDSGQSVSQTAERTKYRGVRRMIERQKLRRERLHRVLSLIGFLPEHYDSQITRYGKFKDNAEPKIAWENIAESKFEFIFKESFNEMLEEFKVVHPDLFGLKKNGEVKKVPYDYTIYYLRKKALKYKINKYELAWILLNFNQKRGYYQLRGEDESAEKTNKLIEFHALRVVDVVADEPQKDKSEVWYSVYLENGWVYRRSSKNPLFDWKDKVREFVVTTELDENGEVKKGKDGAEKRSFRSPKVDDWMLTKKRTEAEIAKSGKSVGTYIYNAILNDPNLKINGKFVNVVERTFYKQELIDILKKQSEFHPELRDRKLYDEALVELYAQNEAHRNMRSCADFIKLFVDDIIFYQRPLKSVKSLICDCPYEYHQYKGKNGEKVVSPVKCIAKSQPLFQEFRLWQFVRNLKIYQREMEIDGRLCVDVDITSEFITSEDDFVALFDWLNDRKEIDQRALLKSYFKVKDPDLYRWNYVEDKKYPCNETRGMILSRLKKANAPDDFLTKDKEQSLWHILYSVEDKYELDKALVKFANDNDLGETFVDVFKRFPPFKKEYGAYSAKAIGRLLKLMRMGYHWDRDAIDPKTKERIEKIVTGECDPQIGLKVREKAINLCGLDDFKGLPLWLACYVVYDRHSESKDAQKWHTPADIDKFLKNEFKQHSLRNPIVEQIICEVLRVIRDAWIQYGDFDEIHVELGREMKNTAAERKKLTNDINANENTNLRIKSLLAELSESAGNVRPYSPSQQEILKIYEDGVLKSGIEIPEDIAKISKSASPSKSELVRYKCWLEQGYRSPYTGQIIPLSKLFTSDYEIEHIIPQSRYFDDSFFNKVITESAVNKDKDNALAYQYIKDNSGKIVELGHGKSAKIFTVDEYEEFVKKYYRQNPKKMKRLLMTDIPEEFSSRQLNDARYISKVVKGLLSNIVREEKEEEATSKNVIVCSGGVTSELKKQWGLNDVWNRIVTPRFERMNRLTSSNYFGEWMNKDGKVIFQTRMPLQLQKGFRKKRIDHRHHALDALVIACATRNHVNFLNNINAADKDSKVRHDLKMSLCFKEKQDASGSYVWRFHKPWDSFTQDVQSAIEQIVVSFKQNSRVINKTVNKYQRYVDGKKVTDTQVKGDRWAIRKPLHQETVSGLVNIRLRKQVSLSVGVDNYEALVDKQLKKQIKQLVNQGFDKAKILKFFKNEDGLWADKNLSKVEIYYFSNDDQPMVASRVTLDSSFNVKKIGTITDSGIRKIALSHLAQNEDDPELAFSCEGIDKMNENIRQLNNGRLHKPITKVRTYEPLGNKFNVGISGNKGSKFVIAATGTNLYFAIYVDDQNKRSYETIPLNVVIDRLKSGLSAVPESNAAGARLLFSLSPNDLVYIPTQDELESGVIKSELDKSRVYKFVDSSGTTANFVPANVASILFNMTTKEQGKLGLAFGIQNEFGEGSLQSKNQKAITGEMCKAVCVKLIVDRLGQITKIIK